MCRLLSLLGRRRIILVSPYASASMVLVAKAIVEALHTYGSIGLVDGGGFRVDVLENMGGPDILGRILVYKGMLPSSNIPLALYNAGSLLSLAPVDRLVVASVLRPGEVPGKLRRDVVRLQRVSGSLYLLRGGRDACMVEISGGKISEAKPRGYEARALSILMHASVEYGPLSVRDAVDVLSSELSMDRSRTRMLLSRLAERRLITVEKGFVLVEYQAR